ncbi:MAG: dipeptidase [Alphaproteobacteria bacterium]|nr:dipeptidase [Alphaproteobacteria bacterium]
MLRKIALGAAILIGLGAVAGLAIAPGLVEDDLNRVIPHAPYPVSAEAQVLHRGLGIVDLHADTLMWDRDILNRSRRGHVDVPRLREGRVSIQVFSVVTKVPARLNYDRNTGDEDQISLLVKAQLWPTRTWSSLVERALYQSEKLYAAAAAEPDQIRVITSAAALAQGLEAKAGNPDLVLALLAIEGAHALEGKAENLERLYAAGFRMIGISHFFDNEMGGSLHGIDKGGLTDFGRAMVKRMEEMGIIVDLAHASPAVVDDVLAMATRPLVVSHTGVRGVCGSPRNLSDERMQAIAAKGGLIGIGYWKGAICDITPAGVAKALRAAIDLVGLEHVALGSDFDGATEVSFDTSELAALVEAMLAQGFTEEEIDRVMGANAREFLLVNLPAR